MANTPASVDAGGTLVYASGSVYALRGGGWYFSAGYCRSVYRFRYQPGFRYYFLGFRAGR